MPKRNKEMKNNAVVKMEEPNKGLKKSSKKKCDAIVTDITEDFVLLVENAIRTLQSCSDENSHTFPSNLTNLQRKYIHSRCRNYGLKSRSHGKEPNRVIEIFLRRNQNNKTFIVECNDKITKLMNKSLSLLNETQKFNKSKISNKRYSSYHINSRLNSECQVLVRKVSYTKYLAARKRLPIYEKKSEFLDLLNKHQVLLISSETGSGKTTQIPQFILEQASKQKAYCKIVCTQPRRISTIAVAERVATERNEIVGQTVGYQIKFESRVGPESALIYCTNGVLLRTLMSRDIKFFKTITHIILDEIHERDKCTDILLITVKECLKHNPQLKLILMSATCEVALFMSYFTDVQLLHVEGRNYEIKEYFLDDIWKCLGDKEASSQKATVADCKSAVPTAAIDYDADEMNYVINRCIELKEEDDCFQLLQLILSENADMNHQTSDLGYTPLMAAAISGNLELAEVLLKMGADISIKSHLLGYTADLWAKEYENEDVYNFINSYASSTTVGQPLNQQHLPQISERIDNFIKIDYELIIKLITYINSNDKQGTILIFFPGYEDIMTCMQKISTSSLDQCKLHIICLHSSMPNYERQSVFRTFLNRQKIILSTNIAETGITIPDVVYVIDTGLAKETSYDCLSDTCILQKTYISKASADQRSGRAGRTRNGICFRLYSKSCYDSLVPDRIPEILRVPLYELCLQTKLLSSEDEKISDFLKLAIQCPPQTSIDCAIDGLIMMGALNEDEELTLLGQHILQLSLEPRLAKMLIYSVLLKCLDPVLTIVSSLSQEPFCLPFDPKDRRLASDKQKQLSANSLSDHYILFKAYHIWQVSKMDMTYEIDDYFINASGMELINSTRSQLLSQLQSIEFIDSRNYIKNIKDLNINSNKWAVVKAVMAVGCYPNLAFTKSKNMSTRCIKNVQFSATSALKNISMPDYCVIYEELSKTVGRHVVRCGTIVTPLTVALMCGEADETSTNKSISIDDWIEIQHSYPHLIKYRTMINMVLNRKISRPFYIFNDIEDEFLQYLVNMLVEEDTSHNLANPSDIAKCGNFNSYNNTWRREINNRQLTLGTQLLQNSIRTEFEVNSSNILEYSTNHNSKHRKDFNSFEKNCKNRYECKVPARNKGPTSDLLSESPQCSQNEVSLTTISDAGLDVNSASKLLSAIDLDSITPSQLLLNGIQAGTTLSKENENLIHMGNNYCFKIPATSVFFMIKPSDEDELKDGILNNEWMFPPEIKKKLFKFFSRHYSVYLFFTICNTREFQGFARLIGSQSGFIELVCQIEWLSTQPVSYDIIEMMALSNPSNNNLLVFHSKDGQEIDFYAAQQLVQMFSISTKCL